MCLHINASHRVLDQCDYISEKAGWCSGSGGQREEKRTGERGLRGEEEEVRVKARGSSRRTACLKPRGGRDDSVAIWCKTGVGQGQKGVGSERKKQTMLPTGRRAGAHRSAVCRLFASSLANRGPSVDHLQRQCEDEDEDAPSGDTEMCTKLRKFSTFCTMRIKWLHGAEVKMPFRNAQQSAKSLCIHS